MSYFIQSEFECKCGCGAYKLSPGFLEALNELRDEFNHAMLINSGCRCEKHNAAVNGRPGSYHLVTKPWGCCAVDISTRGWPGWRKREFLKLAVLRGFSVGAAPNFIHLDHRHLFDKDWPKPVFFTY